MFCFLKDIYKSTQSDGIRRLLGSMSLFGDRAPADSVLKTDWAFAFRAALHGKVNASMRPGAST